MKNLFTPFRVGLLVLASAIFLFVFITFVRKGGLSRSDAVDYWALFHDASGLSQKSRVQIAGIPVGEITRIELQGTRAKVWIRVRRDVGVRTNARLAKRSESLLGDYLVDLYPGTEDQPLLPEGGEIPTVLDQQGMQQVFESLGRITSDIEAVTGALRQSLGGQQGADSLQHIVGNLIRLTDALDVTVRHSAEQLDTIMTNVEGVSADVRGATRGEDERIRLIIDNISQITADTRDVMREVKSMVGAGQGDIKDSVAGLKTTLARLDRTLANVETVTENIKEGKGTVGELLSDERLGKKLGETLEDVSDYASRLTGLQTQVGIKSEYLFSQGRAKDTFELRLVPKPDKYYLLELVDDPRGTVNRVTVQTNPPNVGNPVTQEIRTTTDSLKFSAEFAKRYYFATLRFGLIESTGGLGADLHFLNDALTMKFDAFNFSDRELKYPRVRTTAELKLFSHILLTAGADDILNQQVTDSATNRLIAGRDFFLGGGIVFTDDDLKAILTAVGGVSPRP